MSEAEFQSEAVAEGPGPEPTQAPQGEWAPEPSAPVALVEQPGQYDLTGIEYDIDLPWDGEFQSRMVGQMRRLGLSNDQVNGLIQEYIDDQGGTYATSMGEAAAKRETGLADLKAEWGTGFEARVALAKTAFRDAAGSGFEELANLQLADGGVLGDHPAVVKAFAVLGGKLQQRATPGAVPTSAPPSSQSTDPYTLTPQQAREARIELEADPKFMAAWMSGEHPMHDSAVRRLHELAEAEVGRG